MILDQLAKDYKPIVQVIDNLERNHKLVLNVRSLEKGAYLLKATDKAGAYECLKFLK